MTITDYPKGKGKNRVDGYTSADSKRFKHTYLNQTLNKKIQKPEKITATDLDEFYTSVLDATHLTTREDFDTLFGKVANSSATFANVGAFLTELDRLASEWENQGSSSTPTKSQIRSRALVTISLRPASTERSGSSMPGRSTTGLSRRA